MSGRPGYRSRGNAPPRYIGEMNDQAIVDFATDLHKTGNGYNENVLDQKMTALIDVMQVKPGDYTSIIHRIHNWQVDDPNAVKPHSGDADTTLITEKFVEETLEKDDKEEKKEDDGPRMRHIICNVAIDIDKSTGDAEVALPEVDELFKQNGEIIVLDALPIHQKNTLPHGVRGALNKHSTNGSHTNNVPLRIGTEGARYSPSKSVKDKVTYSNGLVTSVFNIPRRSDHTQPVQDWGNSSKEFMRIIKENVIHPAVTRAATMDFAKAREDGLWKTLTTDDHRIKNAFFFIKVKKIIGKTREARLYNGLLKLHPYIEQHFNYNINDVQWNFFDANTKKSWAYVPLSVLHFMFIKNNMNEISHRTIGKGDRMQIVFDRTDKPGLIGAVPESEELHYNGLIHAHEIDASFILTYVLKPTFDKIYKKVKGLVQDDEIMEDDSEDDGVENPDYYQMLQDLEWDDNTDGTPPSLEDGLQLIADGPNAIFAYKTENRRNRNKRNISDVSAMPPKSK